MIYDATYGYCQPIFFIIANVRMGAIILSIVVSFSKRFLCEEAQQVLVHKKSLLHQDWFTDPWI